MNLKKELPWSLWVALGSCVYREASVMLPARVYPETIPLHWSLRMERADFGARPLWHII